MYACHAIPTNTNFYLVMPYRRECVWSSTKHCDVLCAGGARKDNGGVAEVLCVFLAHFPRHRSDIQPSWITYIYRKVPDARTGYGTHLDTCKIHHVLHVSSPSRLQQICFMKKKNS